MASDRVQRQFDRLLDEAEAAIAVRDWAAVGDRARNVLRLDPENSGALFLHCSSSAGSRRLKRSVNYPTFPLGGISRYCPSHLLRQWPLPGLHQASEFVMLAQPVNGSRIDAITSINQIESRPDRQHVNKLTVKNPAA